MPSARGWPQHPLGCSGQLPAVQPHSSSHTPNTKQVTTPTLTSPTLPTPSPAPPAMNWNELAVRMLLLLFFVLPGAAAVGGTAAGQYAAVAMAAAAPAAVGVAGLVNAVAGMTSGEYDLHRRKIDKIRAGQVQKEHSDPMVVKWAIELKAAHPAFTAMHSHRRGELDPAVEARVRHPAADDVIGDAVPVGHSEDRLGRRGGARAGPSPLRHVRLLVVLPSRQICGHSKTPTATRGSVDGREREAARTWWVCRTGHSLNKTSADTFRGSLRSMSWLFCAFEGLAGAAFRCT